MSNSVIKVENLSKKYIIGHQAEGRRYVALRDILADGARSVVKKFLNPFCKGNGKQYTTREEFWALRDISFEINQGDRVGIIGRNGAGKSTLLKVLSRITEPSGGKVHIVGRVASLLEVGTGFHPELTGRENIYLNGAILGMGNSEIRRKFEEIVEFAEIDKFLDTPVKRYSSGMYVRLAFAVAAHLEPEILLVDEVLAVGDVQFQKKCLGKMQDVSREGRTVLFVSHNMPMITSLCQCALLLDSGKIKSTGNVSDVVLEYYTSGDNSPAFFDYSNGNKKVGDEYVTLISGSIRDKNNEIITEVEIDQPLRICINCFILKKNMLNFVPNFHFFTADGTYAFVANTGKMEMHETGNYFCECLIPENFLNEGTYFVGLAVSSFDSGVKVHFYETNALSFNVKDNIDKRNFDYSGPIPGTVRPKLQWRFYRDNEGSNSGRWYGNTPQ